MNAHRGVSCSQKSSVAYATLLAWRPFVCRVCCGRNAHVSESLVNVAQECRADACVMSKNELFQRTIVITSQSCASPGVAPQAQIKRTFGVPLAYLYPLVFAPIFGFLTNFCKSLMKVLQELCAYACVSSGSVAGHLRSSCASGLRSATMHKSRRGATEPWYSRGFPWHRRGTSVACEHAFGLIYPLISNLYHRPIENRLSVPRNGFAVPRFCRCPLSLSAHPVSFLVWGVLVPALADLLQNTSFSLSLHRVFLFRLGRIASQPKQKNDFLQQSCIWLCGLVFVTRRHGDDCSFLVTYRAPLTKVSVCLVPDACGARTSNTRPSIFTGSVLRRLVTRFHGTLGGTLMVRIVNRGVDTLIVNVKYLNGTGAPATHQACPLWLEELLQRWQDTAREAVTPLATSMTFNDARLMMLPNGASVWKYILRNDSVQVQLVPRLTIPALARVTFSSAYLWSCASPQDAVDAVHAWCIDTFGGDVLLQAAQVDLCVDVTGLRLPLDWQKVFVSRARGKSPTGPSQKDQAFYRGPRLETLLFSGHGQPVSCKIYDKIAEITQRSPEKVWFYPLWTRNGWNGTDPVWRIEFSERRECLHEQDLEDIYDALRNLKRIWAYCTQDWLRMVTPGATPNRTRWATSPAWTQIQHAFDTYGDTMLDALGPLVREAKREVNMARGVAAIAGYATTLAAWAEDGTWSDIDPAILMEMVSEQVQQRWRERGVVLADVVRDKQFLYGRKG